MTGAPLNVLLLTVDAWRADRLSLYGYGRPTTPVLDRFAANATVCERAFSLGSFTQVACIQLFTSSRPMSYGGYDRGAAGRPDTLFKRFHDAGYRTWGLSTIHWVSPYYGYTEGLDEEIGVFHLNTLVGMAITNLRDTMRVYHEEKISAEDMLSTAVPVIRRLFGNVDDYCDRARENGPAYAADFPDSKVVHDGYDEGKVKRVVARHRAAFEADALAYVHEHLDPFPDANGWMVADWYYSRTPAKLIREAAFRLTNRLLGFVDPRRAALRANRIRLAVDAHAIARKVTRQLHNRDPDRPFFIWAHFKDTHRPYVSGPGRQWYKHTPAYLDALGYARDLDPAAVFRTESPRTEEQWATASALYDAALRSTDEAMGRILDAVEGLGLGDNTVVCICGDHGEEIGEHGDYGHRCMPYEHNVRIPMLFRRGREAGKRIDSLVTALDWAPTIAGLAGVDPAPGWEGRPVTSDDAARRDHVLLETFCRGDCIFEHRPLYMSVRTRRHKYIWKEYRDPFDTFSPDGHELYDLDADPGERNNLYRPDHPVVADLNPVIVARLREIPEISPARIDAAFAPARPQPVAAG